MRVWSRDSTIGCHSNGTTVLLWNSSDQLSWITTADYFHEKRIQRGLIRPMSDARGDVRLAGKDGGLALRTPNPTALSSKR